MNTEPAGNETLQDGRQNILVVDDNPRNLALLDDILCQAGYRVRPAITGLLALQSALAHKPDLVLLDIRLPDIDGYEVCRRLKADPRTEEVPVVFISALDEAQEKIRAFAEGGIDYITKPFQSEEVVARIRTHLSLRAMRLALKDRNARLQEEIVQRETAQIQLQEAHGQLEHRVERRTAALAKAVKALEQEIEERKQTEAALRESEERYRVTIENAVSGIGIVDQGRLLFANQRLLALFGHGDSKAILGHSFIDLFVPADQGAVRDILAKGVPRDSGGTIELQAKSRHGLLMWLEMSAARTTYRGKVVSLVYLRDITARKKAEEERTLLATALEQAAESVMITDRQARILYVNPFFEQSTGYLRQEVLGLTPKFLKSGVHDRHFYAQLTRTLRSGKGWQGRFTNRRKDGAFLEEDAVISPVFDQAGAISHYIAVKRDITRTLQMEKQLQQAQKMEAIGTLAGGIAHDFNNILGAIIGCAEVAMAEIPADSRALADLERVLKAGQRARRLVQQILTFSRQSPGELRPLKIGPIIKETVRFLRASLPSTITIDTQLSQPDAVIMADPVQVQQILLNLCSNAGHAMGTDAGLLQISLDRVQVEEQENRLNGLRRGAYVRLLVRDSGHGMSKVVLDRIFDPFFTTKGVGEGTGLGLSVVHGIVTDLGGQIVVDSEAGQGTTFLIYLPWHSGVEEEARPVDHLPRSLRGERVLVVDDETYLADTMQRSLTQLGYQTISCSSCEEALSLVRSDPQGFDAVVTDLTMPGMNGDHLLRECRRLGSTAVAILCTGYSDRALALKGLPGVQAILYKPVLKQQLAKALRAALGDQAEQESMG